MKKLISILCLLLASIAVFAETPITYNDFVYSGSGRTEKRAQYVTSFTCQARLSPLSTINVTAISVKKNSRTMVFAILTESRENGNGDNIIITDTDVDETVRFLTQMLPVVQDGFKGTLASGESYEDFYMSGTGFSVGYAARGEQIAWFIMFGGKEYNYKMRFCSPETLLEAFTSTQKVIDTLKNAK